MILFLRFLFASISLTMTAIAIWTSLQSNMFAVGPQLMREPWFVATLQDFYFNVLIIYCWVIYKERRFWPCAVWFAAFVILGSIATSFYVFLQLMKLKPGDSLEKLFV